MKTTIFILGLFMAISNIAFANTLGSVDARVTGTGAYADGSIYIFFDRNISSCNSNPTGRLDIEATHPARTQILSIAMTAFTSGTLVKVHPGLCNGSNPYFGTGKSSFIYLTNGTL